MSLDHHLLVEARIANEQKSVGVAYALWFFLGFFSAHRFYLNRPGTAILQIFSYFILVGFVWWLIDAFLIGDMIERDRQRLRMRLMSEIVPTTTHQQQQPMPDMSRWSKRDRDAYLARLNT